MFFLDINIIHEQSKFTNSIHCKPTFSRVYTHFDSFLPFTYKIGMTHKLSFRCFWIWQGWTKFCLELVKLMDVFESNGYPENFINNFFKTYLNNKHRKQREVITAHKKPLFFVLPCLGRLTLQTRTKLGRSPKCILNCYKIQILFKSHDKFANALFFFSFLHI